MLTIYVDFKSAASYLALEPTLRLIEETGVEAKWLPFCSRPFTIPEEKPDETIGERHRRVRAIAQRDTHLHYAKVQGLEMRFPEQPIKTNAALAALAVLEGDPVPFIRAAFAAYWRDQRDLNNREAVTQILNKPGHEEPNWTAAKGMWEMVYLTVEKLKVFETPTYLINDQIFLGREHLPWIRSIIAVKQST